MKLNNYEQKWNGDWEFLLQHSVEYLDLKHYEVGTWPDRQTDRHQPIGVLEISYVCMCIYVWN